MLFRDIFAEAYSPPVRWKWTAQSAIEFSAMFKIGAIKYSVSIFRYDSTLDAWELGFTAESRKEDYGFRASGTGNAFQVLGTVIAIARKFMTLKHPKMMKIESDPTERARMAVNKRIAAAIVQGSDYTVSDNGHDEIIIQQAAIIQF